MRTDEFAQKYLNNGGYDIDGSFGIQCVDLFKIFENDNWGTFTACPSGLAGSYFTAYDDEDFIKEHFQKIDGTDFKNGDWVVFPEGSQVAPDSHICMYYNGQALGCNQNGVRCCTLIDIDWSQACGALRPIDVWEDVAPADEPTAGTYTCMVECVNVRTEPSTEAEIRAQYTAGQTVNILDVVHTNGYYWGHYISWSGVDSYTALRTDDGVDYWSK
jgi:hypothetical protein